MKRANRASASAALPALSGCPRASRFSTSSAPELDESSLPELLQLAVLPLSAHMLSWMPACLFIALGSGAVASMASLSTKGTVGGPGVGAGAAAGVCSSVMLGGVTRELLLN
eukprot:CAMPEP_0202349656 /NCGR_PEP_ID=MMETSP1126-20121109/7058_1 /ASSEMBLY_ACC=CAM_ASM_000457 /TAXON_ID=3047 /ORGANISM="Dunaliella tertiolecta, Strain CCMP1320" /LENGTH=111 /DNA_ID=CAMNT_0048941505 /DNA_START=463 /DNA_END=798 /DNA_ORIENTATION=-